jgi:Pretoxin HINT domain
MHGVSTDEQTNAAAHRGRSRLKAAAAMLRWLLIDRRGGGMLQTIILASAVALAGVAGYKALGSAANESADCAGKKVGALGGGAVPCREGGEESAPASVSGAPPAPESQPPNTEQFDPLEELKRLALDILGVTDAVKCFTEGDIMACVMTALSLSPFKAIGVAVKLAKNAKRIKQAVDRFLAFMAAKRRADRAREVADAARDGERVADNAGDVGRNCRRTGRCGPDGKCFVAGTPVHTENGWVPIEELGVGDLVLSRDDETGEEAYRPIAAVMITPNKPVLALSLEDSMGAIETIEATPPHPFFVDGRGWVAASELRPDDQVVSSGGGRLRVASTTEVLRRTTVYNFEVADFHTYFVGEGAAWVHNDYDPTLFGASGTKTFSTTVFKGQGRRAPRIDVENPNPGQRAGQIHFQQGDKKFLYNPETKTFEGAPRSVNDMLKKPEVQRAIDKAMKILGEA